MDDFCGYSSIDVHNQYALEQYVNVNIIGIVVALCDSLNGVNPIWNAFNLASENRNRVEQCSASNNLANIQHPQCNGMDHFFLFESCGHLIKEVNTSGKVIDCRNLQRSLINDISAIEENISDSNENEYEAKSNDDGSNLDESFKGKSMTIITITLFRWHGQSSHAWYMQSFPTKNISILYSFH